MNRRRIHGGTGIAAVLIAAGMLVPAGATAAPAKPGVQALSAANVAQNSVTLRGRVNPNERATSYYFEYGTTKAYGTQAPVPAASVGRGNRFVGVSGNIVGLAPFTTYHYRVVARNARGVTRGPDRAFKTRRQPLGLTYAASPNPVRPGSDTTISGTLSGTGNGGRQIQLQSNPFPYTQGFQNASNVQLTNADGSFGFPILSVAQNTQYRVVLPNQPQVQSPIVTVGVAPKVAVKVRRVRSTRRGALYRFTGRVTPAHDGAQIAIQRLRRGNWVTINGTFAKHTSSGYSRFRKSVRLRRGGLYRVWAGTDDGDHVASASRSVRLHPRR